MSSFRGFCSVQPERQSSESAQGVLRRRLRRTPRRGCAAENLRLGLRAAVDENAPLGVVYHDTEPLDQQCVLQRKGAPRLQRPLAPVSPPIRAQRPPRDVSTALHLS